MLIRAAAKSKTIIKQAAAAAPQAPYTLAVVRPCLMWLFRLVSAEKLPVYCTIPIQWNRSPNCSEQLLVHQCCLQYCDYMSLVDFAKNWNNRGIIMSAFNNEERSSSSQQNDIINLKKKEFGGNYIFARHILL